MLLLLASQIKNDQITSVRDCLLNNNRKIFIFI